MQYLEAITDEKPTYKDRIFLGGTITGSKDWQNYVVEGIRDLPITVYNPRRKSFDITKKNESEKQIKWEYDALRSASHVMFWFAKETLGPIVLFELGSALERTENIIIGADPKYERLFDVEYQSNLRRPGTKVLNSLDKVILEIRKTFAK